MWKTQRSTVKGYFLAGGQMAWWPVSNIIVTLLVWWPVSIITVTLLAAPAASSTVKCFSPSRTYFSKYKTETNLKSFLDCKVLVTTVGFIETRTWSKLQVICQSPMPYNSHPISAGLHAVIWRSLELPGWSPGCWVRCFIWAGLVTQ